MCCGVFIPGRRYQACSARCCSDILSSSQSCFSDQSVDYNLGDNIGPGGITFHTRDYPSFAGRKQCDIWHDRFHNLVQEDMTRAPRRIRAAHSQVTVKFPCAINSRRATADYSQAAAPLTQLLAHLNRCGRAHARASGVCAFSWPPAPRAGPSACARGGMPERRRWYARCARIGDACRCWSAGAGAREARASGMPGDAAVPAPARAMRARAHA